MSSFSQRDLCDLRFLRIFLKNTLAYDTCGSSVVGSRVFFAAFSRVGDRAGCRTACRRARYDAVVRTAAGDGGFRRARRLEKRLDELDASGSTACWRRCIGVWRLDDEGILWLECVNTEDGDVVFSGAELVPEFAAGSRARPAGSAERSAMARGIRCITNTMDLCGISNANGWLRCPRGA